MTKKIFAYSFLVGALALLLCAGLFFGLQYRQTLDEAYETLRQETYYVAQGVEQNGEDYLNNLASDKRITWMDEAGNALYDTHSADLPNQGSLAEVQSAQETGSGQATRWSGSENVMNLYYALRLRDGSIVRLSMPVSAVRAALITVSPVLWVFVLVLTLSGLLSFRAARQIVRPINELDLDHPEKSPVYPELSPLVARLQEQRLTIDDQLETLHRRQKEFTALADSMSEGFLLLDKSGKVLSANACARQLLPELTDGDAIVSCPQTKAVAEQAMASGEHSETDLQKNGRSWRLMASPVRSHGSVVGAVLLWMDVTERAQRERLRQEFSANVSHELKTPLTSISGFAELMAQGNVPPDRVKEFSADIHREAQRLIALIEDIMKLSHLDENESLPDQEPVDLYSLCQDVMDILTPAAEKQEIRMVLEGEKTEIPGVWQLLHEMVYNLCDNAIKYNRPGGSVTVTVKKLYDTVRLSVADTGIGIPQAEQSRVFERFYRVDKSHSRQIGGTGLGLSIVKHGAQLHNARLTLKSTPDKGTTVTLDFPCQKSGK